MSTIVTSAIDEEMKQLAADRARIDQQMATLEEMRARLTGQTPARASFPRSAAPNGGKAPAGALKAAIMILFESGKAKFTNGQVRSKLKANGYRYSLGDRHIGKTLQALVDEKKLKCEGPRSRTEYSRGK